ncbi:MAG: hypothetical protein IPG18_00655 [Saprospiraceae bacterium]|nr:hypothetical protein [Saprospiraceae bacterium]
MYMIFGLLGCTTILETPSTTALSEVVVQLLPPSVVFQGPPPSEPIYIILLLVGWKTTQFILPNPHNTT